MPQRRITDITNPQKDYTENKKRQAISCVYLSVKDENDMCLDKNGEKCICVGKSIKDCKCPIGHKHYKRN
jgi:hypothetical protein